MKVAFPEPSGRAAAGRLGPEPMEDHRDEEIWPQDRDREPNDDRLPDLRRERLSDRELRARLGRAAIEMAGEKGYANLTVQHIIEHAGVSRSLFYRLFADRGECFLTGYMLAADDFSARIMGSCEAVEGWRAGLRAVLAEIAYYLRDQPSLARGTLAEAGVAGDAALDYRSQVLRRFTQAIDAAREDPEAVKPPPPPSTSDFVASAIEAAALRALAGEAPEDFERIVPDLAYIAVSMYFGIELAQKELGRR